jgi:hypothetical protein
MRHQSRRSFLKLTASILCVGGAPTSAVQVRRCLTLGGKIYPPFAPVLTREDWQRHYGPQLWQRFADAKKHSIRTACSSPAQACSAERS